MFRPCESSTGPRELVRPRELTPGCPVGFAPPTVAVLALVDTATTPAIGRQQRSPPSGMATRFDAAGGQIDGDRDYQEDAFLITRLGEGEREGTLIVVADGMGGHAAGNVASNMAVQTCNKFITAHFPCPDAAAVLRDSVLAANDSIAETVRETAALRGMGCTLVACLLQTGRLHWVSVGDSHLFLFRAGELVKCNADHSYGAFLDRVAAAGQEVKPDAGLSRNMLMSALTGDDIPEVDCPTAGLELRAGDRLIVCSDGIDSIGAAQIREIVHGQASARSCVDALLEAVTAAAVPRQDNTTVVIVDVLGAAVNDRADRPRFGSASGTTAGHAFGSHGTGSTAAIDREAPGSTTGQGNRDASTPATTGHGNEGTQSGQAPERPSGIRRFEPSEVARAAPSRLPGLLAGMAALTLIAGAGAWLYHAKQTPPLPPIDLSALPDRVKPATDSSGQVATTAAETGPATADDGTQSAVPALPAPFRDALAGGGEGPLMLAVPAGSFQMGSGLLGDTLDEGPVREVRLAAFALSAHEVTRAEWNRFARSQRLPLQAGAEDQPASNISWQAATAYAAWLAKQSNQPYRLPTEAEWEYAARAGSPGLYWWGNAPGNGQAWCLGCAPDLEPLEPTRVGQFNANPFGLFDTAGNVSEWVADCYRPSYDNAPVDGSAVEEAGCTLRVHRGGSWRSPSKHLRTTRRAHAPATEQDTAVGLRVARDLPAL